MNINHVVWVRSKWFAEIKTGMIIGERRPMRLSFAHSSAHYQRTRQFLKAEEFQRNSVILTRKHNKEYRLHVARQFCMLWKTLSLCIFLCTRACACVCVCVCVWERETKLRRALCVCVCEWERERQSYASPALHTRVYGTSNTATLRIHSDELKNKMIIIL